MKRTLLAWLVPTTLIIPMTAHTAPVEPQSNAENVQPLPFLQSPHFYVGGRGGWSYFQDACDSSASACYEDALGGGVFGGYQLSDWFALEGGVTDYGKTKADYNSGRVSSSAIGAELSAKFSYSVSPRWILFSRVGAAYQDIEKSSPSGKNQDSQDWNTLVAVGVDYRLAPRWSLRSEYQFIDGIGSSETSQSDLHFTSLGLTYHFGQKEHSQVKVQAPVEASKPLVRQEEISLDVDTLFAFDSTTLQNDKQLEDLVEVLIRHNVGKVSITGYTDNLGSERYNQTLSEQRAQAVADYLIEEGIASERLEVSGSGESYPVADNNTAEGRTKNRRVEVRFTTFENVVE